MGEGAPDVVVPVPPLLDEPLELGHNEVIAALAGVVLPQAVVDLLPPVQAEDHVVHLPVAEFGDLVVQQHPVGGEGEAEVLVVGCLLAAGVGHQVLDHLPVHQGFPPEEVHLQVHPGAGVLDEEVQGLLAHLEGHQGPVPVVPALGGKAVLAVEVAGVGHVEAQGLQDGFGVLEGLLLHVLPQVLGEELAGGFQGVDVLQAGQDLPLVHVRPVAVLGQDLGDDGLPGGGLVQGDDVIGHLVHQVDRAAVHVQDDVVAVEFVLMDHKRLVVPFRPTKKVPLDRARSGGSFLRVVSSLSGCCFRTAGWQGRRRSCRQTGRRSGIRRSRRFSGSWPGPGSPGSGFSSWETAPFYHGAPRRATAS